MYIPVSRQPSIFCDELLQPIFNVISSSSPGSSLCSLAVDVPVNDRCRQIIRHDYNDLFTPPTRRDKTVLSRPRRRCEQATNVQNTEAFVFGLLTRAVIFQYLKSIQYRLLESKSAII